MNLYELYKYLLITPFYQWEALPIWQAVLFYESESVITRMGHGLTLSIISAYIEGVSEMTNKKNAKNERKKADWKGFINLDMTVDQWHDFDDSKTTPKDMLSSMSALVEAGFKVNITPLPDGESVNASLFQQFADMTCPGWTLSAFAPSASEALEILFYKHFVVLGGVWDIKKINESKRRG